MNLLKFKILTTIISLCFASSNKVIVPLESENDNLFDNSPSLDGLKLGPNSTEDSSANNDDSLAKESQSTEAEEPKRSEKDDQPTKIPMKCISDYVEYCRSKFDGFGFQDGCHQCNCSKEKRDFCGKGPCQFYAHSFDQAITYCSEVLANNTKDYNKEMKKRLAPHRDLSRNRTAEVIDEKMNNLDHNVTSGNTIRSMVKPNISIEKSDVRNDFRIKIFAKNMSILHKMVNQTNLKKTQENDEKVKKDFILSTGNVTEQVGLPMSIQIQDKGINSSRIQANLPKMFSQGSLDKEQNGENVTEKVLSSMSESNIGNDSVKAELTKDLSTKFDSTLEDNLPRRKPNKTMESYIQENEKKVIERKIKGKKVRNNTFDVTKPEIKIKNIIKLEKKKTLNGRKRDQGENIHDKASAIQSSLKKISDKKMLRHIIYFIALNELSIKRIFKKTKGHVSNEDTKLFRQRLKDIQSKNSMYKSKILKIVKMKLKLTKSTYGAFNHRFNKEFFTKIVRKLNMLNAELHEMKGGVKMWSKMSKALFNAPKQLLKCACVSKMSLITMITVAATFLLWFR